MALNQRSKYFWSFGSLTLGILKSWHIQIAYSPDATHRYIGNELPNKHEFWVATRRDTEKYSIWLKSQETEKRTVDSAKCCSPELVFGKRRWLELQWSNWSMKGKWLAKINYWSRVQLHPLSFSTRSWAKGTIVSKFYIGSLICVSAFSANPWTTNVGKCILPTVWTQSKGKFEYCERERPF